MKVEPSGDMPAQRYVKPNLLVRATITVKPTYLMPAIIALKPKYSRAGHATSGTQHHAAR